MARNQKFFPADVLAILKKGPATREEIADILGCQVRTASRLVGKLVGDGEDIGWNGGGYFLLTEELKGTSVQTAQKWTDTLTSFIIRIGKHAKAHRPIAKKIRARIGDELTGPERQSLKAELLLLGRVIDAVDLDEELGT